MPNAPITTPERPDIDHAVNHMATKCATKCNVSEMAVIETDAGEHGLESAPPHASGVLRELALARWRGSTTQVPGPPQRDDDRNR